MAGEKDDDKKVGEEEEQYVAVEDEPPGKQQAADDKLGDGAGDGDDDGHDDDDDDGQQQDERLAGDQEDPDDKKTRRKSENKTRRARQKEARDRTEREITFLRTRNEDLERRFSHFEQESDARITGSEIASIDVALNKARSDMQLANQVIEQAVAANDGKNLAEALDHRDSIRDNLRDLESAKGYLADSGRREAPPAQQPLDPRHVAHAQSFMVDNDWWDPAGRDQDSKAVLDIDRSLVREGFNPAQKDYWDELRTRTKKALPDRFDTDSGDGDGDAGKGSGNGQQQLANQNKGPQFRTGGRERPLKKNEVYISPERKDAMIEAGIWDDPVARNSMLKRYAEYDRDAADEKAARG